MTVDQYEGDLCLFTLQTREIAEELNGNVNAATGAYIRTHIVRNNYVHIIIICMHVHTVKPAYNNHSCKGPYNCGLCRQVVLVRRCFSRTGVDNEPAYCGLYRQVVLVQRCFSTVSQPTVVSIDMGSLRPHLHVSRYPCKHILLKTFTQTIYTKTPKTYSECGYFINGYLSGYSINAYIDRFRVNKL